MDALFAQINRATHASGSADDYKSGDIPIEVKFMEEHPKQFQNKLLQEFNAKRVQVQNKTSANPEDVVVRLFDNVSLDEHSSRKALTGRTNEDDQRRRCIERNDKRLDAYKHEAMLEMISRIDAEKAREAQAQAAALAIVNEIAHVQLQADLRERAKIELSKKRESMLATCTEGMVGLARELRTIFYIDARTSRATGIETGSSVSALVLLTQRVMDLWFAAKVTCIDDGRWGLSEFGPFIVAFTTLSQSIKMLAESRFGTAHRPKATPTSYSDVHEWTLSLLVDAMNGHGRFSGYEFADRRDFNRSHAGGEFETRTPADNADEFTFTSKTKDGTRQCTVIETLLPFLALLSH